MKRLHVRIPDECDEALRRACKDYNTTKTAIVTNLLTLWLLKGGYIKDDSTNQQSLKDNDKDR